ncbi:MAG TPA: hypothetical protein VN680_11810 [Burkholderiaceae bacterium]|jgi:hypothetical protein|nr:hypothetical protein [Burkholderiaceae bacterium]
MSPRLQNKRMHLAHLALQIRALESAHVPMDAAAYRLHAKRMRAAVAGCSSESLQAQLGDSHPEVLETLTSRHFEEHGQLPGPSGAAVREAAHALIARLKRA